LPAVPGRVVLDAAGLCRGTAGTTTRPFFGPVGTDFEAAVTAVWDTEACC
jgi:hypothetical protein